MVRANSLASLDGKTIAVKMDPAGDVVLLGNASYYTDETLGPSLRIAIKDSAGNFELLLREDQWNGKMLPADRAGCDFTLEMGIPAPSTQVKD